MRSTSGLALLALATTSYAQGYGGGYGGSSGGNNPYSNGNGNNNGNGFGGELPEFVTRYRIIITAHAVLATLAFGLLFPVGGILIRLASFRGLWLVHGLFQAFAYLLYTAAFGIGIYLAVNLRMLDQAHAIIGILLFVLLFFQPVTGLVHHFAFKKHTRRVVWSYGHIWAGRIAITLGIINGGLGLQLAQQAPILRPTHGVIVGYSVAAAIVWLVYVASIVIGERRRSRAGSRAQDVAEPPVYKPVDGGMAQYA